MIKGKLLFIVVGIVAMMLLAMVAGATRAYFSDPEASSDNLVRTINNWYNLAWHWRKPITISNGGGALTNFQIMMTVDTATLVTAGKMLASGNDIRFSTSDGVTNISYWIQSGINTASTIIWVKVPSLSAGSNTIYMYYGNTGAAAASNGDNTFIFWDDFEVDLAKWTLVNATRGTATRVSTPVVNGSWSMYLNDTSTGGTFGAYAAITAQAQCVIEYYARPAQTNEIWGLQVRRTNAIAPNMRFNSDASVEYFPNAWTDFSPAVTYAANTWYSFKLDNVNASTDTYSVYIDGSLKGSGIAFDNAVADVNRIYFETATAAQVPDLYVDLVKVRAYASPEPTVTVIGAEE